MGNFKLEETFFIRDDTHTIAKELLGKALIRKHKNGRFQVGLIVETESYHGFEDRASHGAKARTNRTEVMFGKGGHYYIYLIYGMYWNLNIVAGKTEFPSAVLVRALEPIYDSEIDMGGLTFKEKFKLASGPGKLCRWMGIDKRFYGRSVEDDELFLVEAKNLAKVVQGSGTNREPQRSKVIDAISLQSNSKIISTKRIGVDYAGESADWDWRYYISGNKYVSKYKQEAQ